MIEVKVVIDLIESPPESVNHLVALTFHTVEALYETPVIAD